MKKNFILAILFIASLVPPYIIVKTLVYLFDEGFWAANIGYPIALLVWAYTMIELDKLSKHLEESKDDS